MNYTVFGDVHGRLNWMSPVNEYLKKGYHIVFIGDYVSTHEYIPGEAQLEVLDEVLSYKEQYPDQITLLRGNHDLQHLGYDWAQCSGLNRTVRREMSKPKVVERYTKDTQWILYDKDINVCFSHAGLSATWMRNNNATLENINEMPIDERFGFTPEHFGDVYGESKTQPPTWIRPTSLAIDSYMPGELIQVVGHTTRDHIEDTWDLLKDFRDRHPEIKFSHIWMTDCNLKEYLVIEDGKFTIKEM